MDKTTLEKVSENGKHYILKPFNDSYYVIWEYCGATGSEVEFAKKIATFDNQEKAMKYWDKIK